VATVSTAESRREWTTDEIRVLEEHCGFGAEYLAHLLGRSEWSVRQQAYRRGLSLRPDGEVKGLRQGAVLTGQHFERIRRLVADVDAGRVSLDEVEAVARSVRRSQLCPACTERYVAVSVSGLCLPCHLVALAEGHEQVTAAEEAKKLLDTKRQRRHRRKRHTELSWRCRRCSRTIWAKGTRPPEKCPFCRARPTKREPQVWEVAA
jgi:hypothetical protein